VAGFRLASEVFRLDDVLLLFEVAGDEAEDEGEIEDGDWLVDGTSVVVVTVVVVVPVPLEPPLPQADKENAVTIAVAKTSAIPRYVVRTVYLRVAVQRISRVSRAKSPWTGQALRPLTLPE
jgi:hypothetical protein